MRLAEDRLLHELGVGVQDVVVAGQAGEEDDVGSVTVRPGDSYSSPTAMSSKKRRESAMRSVRISR